MKRAGRAIVLALIVSLSGTAPGITAGTGPRLALIIDDMGNRHDTGERALHLPGNVTYAFLPGAPATRALARQAHRAGREVMLHQPMQSVTPHALGPGGITLHMTEHALRRQLERNLAAVPYAAGVNNHMGSLITRHPGHMTWVMQELRTHGNLYFVDSRTTKYTVGEQMARENQVPTVRRNVFLDNEPTLPAITAQFDRLVRLARRQGHAVGIAHPHPATLAALETLLPTLAKRGVQLVPASRLVQRPAGQETTTWHASLSPSPTAPRK